MSRKSSGNEITPLAVATRRRLRWGLAFFLLSVAIPLALLVALSIGKLRRDAFLQQRYLAEQAAGAIEQGIAALLSEEEARPFGHYSFYTVATSEVGPSQQALQISPLSQGQSRMPGLVGHFQIAPDGSFSSPLVPESIEQYNAPKSWNQQHKKVASLKQILGATALGTTRSGYSNVEGARKPPRLAAAEQQLKDEESLVSQEGLLRSPLPKAKGNTVDQFWKKDSDGYGAKMLSQKEEFAERRSNVDSIQSLGKLPRKEIANVLSPSVVEQVINAEREQSAIPQAAAAPKPAAQRLVVSFEAEVDPIQLRILPDGHTVFFRKAWNGERRYIQGMVVETSAFFQTVIQQALATAALSPSVRLLVSSLDVPLLRFKQPAYGERSSYISKRVALQQLEVEHNPIPLSGEVLLFSTALPPPLSAFQLHFSADQVPLPNGVALIFSLSAALTLIFIVGLGLVYRVANAQIALAEQRSNFVSAVSHELKTPLTSIRMYGEMLRNDWVKDDAKRKSYYDYIFHESERLSRLINNVLRFSRISNRNDELSLHEVSAEDLLRVAEEKIGHMVQAAAYTLTVERLPADAPKGTVLIDDDAFSQIIINLTDNALKFSQSSGRPEIVLGARYQANGKMLVVYVRDFGPGVPPKEQRKIFELFYRSESELTRKTTGTGIGLALVHNLAERMGAKVDYRSREPGAEFAILLPCR